MTASIFLGIGLEYVDTIFQTIKNSDFSQYTIAGMKTLAVLFFLVNILKKYNEGIADKHGYTWGLSPGELAKNFAVVLVVIFSTQVLGFFDAILVAIEGQYRGTAPALLPLQMQDIPIEEEVGFVKAAQAAMALLYEALVTPLFGFKIIAFIVSIILWILDLFIYPLFLAERFFLLGIMQAFFPLVISLAVFEKFRSMAYNFFKLYTAVYMLVPAFFLVNVFVILTKELNECLIGLSGLVQSKFELEKLSRKLESWHQLEFSSFVKELKKKKVNLTLKEEAEWLTYFEENRKKAQGLQNKIDQTEKEIDQVVYELYGLSEDQIKIVESS